MIKYLLKEGIQMKKVISIFLTIIMFFNAMEIIGIVSLRAILSSSATQKLIKETEVKESGELDPIYNEAEKYGVSEDKIDEVLNSDEAKEYYGTILQKYIDGTDDTLDADTQKLIDEAADKYNIDINEEQKEEITKNINEIVVVNKKEVVNNELADNINKYKKFVKNNALLIISTISLLVEALLIIILNIKKKNFMSYFGVCCLLVAIFTCLLTFGFQIILAALNQDIKLNLVKLFGGFLKKGYILSIGLFIVMIICFIINKIIEF